MAPIVLGYWDIRALATPIRLLLELANADWEDKLYHKNGPPEFEHQAWLNDKFTMGLDFPNLPYLIDGDVKLTQSQVILRYLANKFNLAGSNEMERIRVDLLATQVYDYTWEYWRIVYSPDFSKMRDDYAKVVPEKLKRLSEFIGGNKYALGDKVSYADLMLFEFLESQLYFDADILKDFPNLQQFHKNILALEPVDKYFGSPKAIKFPFSGAPAYFGGAYSEQLQKMAKQ